MLKLFKNLEKKDYIFAFIAGIFIIVQVWLELKIPGYMSDITKLVTESTIFHISYVFLQSHYPFY